MNKNELYYVDDKGQPQDEDLHAEMLDDTKANDVIQKAAIVRAVNDGMNIKDAVRLYGVSSLQNDPAELDTSSDKSLLDAFLDDYYAQSKDHPFDSRSRIVNNNSSMELSKFNGAIHISDVRSLAPKSGAGTAALTFLKELADKHSVRLEGTAKAYDHGRGGHINSTSKLKAWYKKNGFTVGKGSMSDGYAVSYTPKKSDKASINTDEARTLSPTILMYHGTSSEFLRSILKNGLTPGKFGRWTQEDEDTSENQRSRKSYGGVYFTVNVMTARASASNLIMKKYGPWANRKANPLYICAEIQPQSVLPDEDSYTVPMHLVNESIFSDLVIRYRTKFFAKYGNMQESNKQCEDIMNKAIDKMVLRYAGKQNAEDKYGLASPNPNRKDVAELRELAKEALLTEIERQFAHMTKRAGADSYYSSESKIRASLSSISYTDRYGEDGKVRKDYKPEDSWYEKELPPELRAKDVNEAEAAHRKALDAFIRKTKNYAAASMRVADTWTSCRVLQPVTFRGRNRIVAIIEDEALEDSREKAFPSSHKFIVHYGKVPAKFLEQYMERIGGEPPEIVNAREEAQRRKDAASLDTSAKSFTYPELQGVKDHWAPCVVKHVKSQNGRQLFIVNQGSRQIASALLSSSGEYVTDLYVEKEHQRKGIASALYKHIEKAIGKKLKPSPIHQTGEGKAFWKGRKDIASAWAFKDGKLVLAKFVEGEQPRAADGEFSNKQGGNKPASLLVPAQIGEDGKHVNLPEHIPKLPPAWTDVHYNPDPKSALLAIGKDAKGRAQYVYSNKHVSDQAIAKFSRIRDLDSHFSTIQNQNARNQKNTSVKTREHADCLDLIMQTGIRPGSDEDTGAEKKAYGATTLTGQHVTVEKGKVTLKFVGKKGVNLEIPVNNRKLAANLVARSKAAGPDGKLFGDISDASLRDYSHTLGPPKGFKVKDFRTLHANKVALSFMNENPREPKNEKERRAAIVEVAKKASQALGNTVTVILQSYLSPEIFGKYRQASEFKP